MPTVSRVRGRPREGPGVGAEAAGGTWPEGRLDGAVYVLLTGAFEPRFHLPPLPCSRLLTGSISKVIPASWPSVPQAPVYFLFGALAMFSSLPASCPSWTAMVRKEKTKSLQWNGLRGENEWASIFFCVTDVPELRGMRELAFPARVSLTKTVQSEACNLVRL